MVGGGIQDVLVSNQIVGASKVRRLCALARNAAVAVCADHSQQIEAYGREAVDFGVELPVLVEVNVGADRCGVPPGEAAAELARQILDTPGLSFGGLQAYHAAAQHRRTPAERRAAVESAVAGVTKTLEARSLKGIHCENITGAGTGTFNLKAESGVYTELQAGSYIFMDADYARNLDGNGLPLRDFEQSLFVYATVISRPEAGRAILDAGLKAVSIDSGMPVVEGMPDVTYIGAADEHGKLILSDPGRTLRIGDKIKLIPGHCDPTVNLYDEFVCLRRNRVEALWPIMPRSAVR
jgi:D-serine deaminase-like pyridoxal phosphate-dependent protein